MSSSLNLLQSRRPVGRQPGVHITSILFVLRGKGFYRLIFDIGTFMSLTYFHVESGFNWHKAVRAIGLCERYFRKEIKNKTSNSEAVDSFT
jgi:hypothetical protein